MQEFEVILNGIESEPFARGGFGVVHMAEYQGQRVVLKKIPMQGIQITAREKIMKGFAKELTIMTKLVSSRRRADLHKPPQTFKR